MNFSNFRQNNSNTSNNPIELDLSKSITLDLSKSDGFPLREVEVGLAWDPVGQGPEADLDLSAFALHNGRVRTIEDILFYNTPPTASILRYADHSEDSRDGSDADGDDPDEWIRISLDRVPADINRIVFVVTIHEAEIRQQTFGLVRSLVMISDENHRRKATYRLSQDYSTDIAIIVGEVARERNGWVFKGIGEGKFADLNGLLNLYT